MRCPYCQNQISISTAQCPHCGHKLKNGINELAAELGEVVEVRPQRNTKGPPILDLNSQELESWMSEMEGELSTFETEKFDSDPQINPNFEEKSKALQSPVNSLNEIEHLLQASKNIIGAVPTDVQDVIKNLTECLASAYGIQNSAGNAPAIDLHQKESPQVNLLTLEEQLEQELTGLEKEGKSFFPKDKLVQKISCDSKVVTSVTDDVNELTKDLKALLSALHNEGILHSGVGGYTNKATSSDIVENRNDKKFRELFVDEDLWADAEKEIEFTALDLAERREFSVIGSVPFKRSGSIDVLFDLVEEELQHPNSRLRKYKQYLPTSALRVIDSVNLEKVYSKLEKAALREAEDLDHLARVDGFKILVSDSPKEKPVYIKPAPISLRLLGSLADFSLCLILGIVFSCFLFLPAHVSSTFRSFSMPSFHNLLPHLFDIFGLSYLIWILVSVILTAGGGQSPGQSMTKVMVLSPAGNIISFTQALVRALSQTTAFVTFGLSLLPALGKKGQSVHEYLSNTYVAAVNTFEQIQLDKVYGNSNTVKQ